MRACIERLRCASFPSGDMRSSRAAALLGMVFTFSDRRGLRL